MKNFKLFLLIFTVLLWAPLASGHEVSGYIEAEARLFFDDPLFPDQQDHNASLAVLPEYYHEWENGSSVTFTPFARIDSADDERTHFDIRELNYLWLADSYELRIGIGKVFWGVTEFYHLIDIINQTDAVESLDGEDKLGQPMAHLSTPRDYGIFNLFVLPWFRERTFSGADGRLRNAFVVDTDNAEYESADEERHVDWAIRYSHSIGDWDFGIYHFQGTGREPLFIPDFTDTDNPKLTPFYEQIKLTGLDIQMVAGEWLFKLEAIYNSGMNDDYAAATGGFEYTFTRVAETDMDLGVIGEYAYDDRRDNAATVYQNDLILGLRLAVNDMASTTLLAGFIHDMDNTSEIVSIEASRRIGDNIKISLESGLFINPSPDDLLYDLRDDGFVRLEAAVLFLITSLGVSLMLNLSSAMRKVGYF